MSKCRIWTSCKKNQLREMKNFPEWTMNEWKSFRKNSDPKKGKNSKNQNEIAACEQKTSSEKENFCSITVVAFYFKIRAKKLHAANHSLFRSPSCFRLTKITSPIWLQKSWKRVNRSEKKDSARKQFKFLSSKKIRSAIIAGSKKCQRLNYSKKWALTRQKRLRHNRLTSGELLSKDRRVVGFVSS